MLAEARSSLPTSFAQATERAPRFHRAGMRTKIFPSSSTFTSRRGNDVRERQGEDLVSASPSCVKTASWQGHRKVRSVPVHCTRQPMWGHAADTAKISPCSAGLPLPPSRRTTYPMRFSPVNWTAWLPSVATVVTKNHSVGELVRSGSRCCVTCSTSHPLPTPTAAEVATTAPPLRSRRRVMPGLVDEGLFGR